ncbi:MAG: double-strand break repair protein AddB [Alphaproteobacteria bacterium]
MTTAPEIYNIPAGRPFVDALAAGILARLKASGADIKADPLGLADVTILLPTRRACRSLGEAFRRLGGTRAMALPRMLPLGDLDEDELVIADAAEFGMAGGDGGDTGLPMAMAGMRRQLLLSQLVLKLGIESWAEPPGPDQAVRLAAELARLVDQVHTERIGFDRLAALVPEDYARHWQETLEFLKIVTDHWPGMLSSEGAVDAATRRNLVIEAQAEAWRKRPPTTPVIAAGSTGTIPATADLLKVVASLPAGAVVLPGLDMLADAENWQSFVASHPQFSLARLLGHLDATLDAVRDWPAPGVGETAPARQLLIAQALAPAETAPVPLAGDALPLPEALKGVVRLDCSGPQEEAAAIALMMRETLEVEDKTAALVTPDRGLARRVAAELRRWNIEIDDSAGVPLATTPPGAFLRLVAQMMADQVTPFTLLAALKHPVASGGDAPGVFRAKARRLEMLALRGPRPAPGFQGLLAALGAAKDGAGADGPEGLDDIIAWLEPIAQAAEPFAAALAGSGVPLREVVTRHVAFAETLAGGAADGSGAKGLWAGDDGEALAGFISELHAAAEGFPAIQGARYPALLDALLTGRVARPRHGGHPRLNIWGLLEARLQHADLMILGGLNEATWPPDPDPDPWLSRPMRRDFGLPPLERRIGLAAHDFTQAFSAPEVALTRATRVEGTPTVPSRWLLRLDNVMGVAAAKEVLDRGKGWLAWQQALDRPGAYDKPVRPSPCPPVSVRPRRLSVTEVETWMRDPYAIYARHVLKLEPLDAIDADPGAADRGSFIHHALDSFQREWRGDLDDAAYRRLIEIGREAFAGALDRPGIWAFWWPRFERTARWFITHERHRRANAQPLASECRGKLKIIGPAGDFLLVAKADRIDRITATDELAIIDYKTGAIPSKGDVENGFAPQLLLEAVMARWGGFDGVPAGDVTALGYWRLSGGDPAGEDKPIRGDIATLTDDALAGFERLVARFDDPKTPYLARPRPDKAPRFGAYDHLARVKEWSSGLDQGGDGGS